LKIDRELAEEVVAGASREHGSIPGLLRDARRKFGQN
jgi:hypothetical protein